MSLSTHVLDIARGQPAKGVAVRLEALSAGQWSAIAQATTDTSGRCGNLLPESPAADPDRLYRLRFETGAYFAAHQIPSLYPYVDVVFTIADDQHHHVPLLLAANGYTTYRGS